MARALARWAPTRISAVLEPAAGVGSLLAPLIPRLVAQGARVVCVDTDAGALTELSNRYGAVLGSRLVLEQRDYLAATGAADGAGDLRACPQFDCIIMNPPFKSRGGQMLRTPLGPPFSVVAGPLPTEALFLVRAVRHLAPGGRVLAILPSSVVAGDACCELRRALVHYGSIRHVHELPPYPFPGIEARVYLFVFERGSVRSAVTLLNHRLRAPDRLTIPVGALGDGVRLDYGYQEARTQLAAIAAARPDLGWAPLASAVTIQRGVHRGGRRIADVLHTHHFREGFWRPPTDARATRRRDVGGVQTTDLLIARVHRASVSTLGPLLDAGCAAWSDCLLRIRPHATSEQLPLLFAMRVLLALEDVAERLLLRGAGARYITHADLATLGVPLRTAHRYPRLFSSFVAATTRRDAGAMDHAVRETARWISRTSARAAERHASDHTTVLARRGAGHARRVASV